MADEKQVATDWFDRKLKSRFGQRSKVYIYDAIRLANLLVWPWQRLRGVFNKGAKLHMACGAVKLQGWVNVDGNLFRRPDMWLDLRNRLPFGASTVTGVVACHFLEHLYDKELGRFLSECYRVLKPGGFIRLSVPDLDKYIQRYLSNGKTADAAMEFNRGVLFGGAHRRSYNGPLLEQVLRAAGFDNVTIKEPSGSSFLTGEEISLVEQWPEETITVEGTKQAK